MKQPLGPLKETGNALIKIKALKFISNDHVIYQDGINISGHQYDCWRGIRITANNSNEYYKVAVYNLNCDRFFWDNNIRMKPKQMKISELTDSSVKLSEIETGRSSPVYQLYLSLYDNAVEKITFHNLETNKDIVYLKAPSKEILSAIDIPLTHDIKSILNADMANIDGLVERYNAIIKEMACKGRVHEAMAEYFFFHGKIKYNERNHIEARQSLTRCNMLLWLNGFPVNHEAIYWYGKMEEAEGNIVSAKKYYQFALDRYSNNPALITKEQIETALQIITSH